MIVTKALLEKLFSSFSLPLPDEFETPGFPLVSPNDTLPSGVSEEEVAYVCAFILCAGISIFSADLAPAWFLDDGMAHSFYGLPPIESESGNWWAGIETVLVRLYKRSAPNATFPVWATDPNSLPEMSIGYDAMVCLEMYEPWIVQIYNSSFGVPTTMAIVGKSASTDFETDDGNRGPRLDSYTRALNSTDKYFTHLLRYASGFSFEHYRPILCSRINTILHMQNDNSRLWYRPSPTTVSFTGNTGQDGYTELSPQFYADVRGKIDASNTLPLLSGTGPIVVRAYKDEVLASASFNPYILGGVLGITLVLGALAGLFVPALPFDITRRGFGLFSWLAVLYGQELEGVFWQGNVHRHMDLKELEKALGEERVHFIIQ